MPTPVRNMMVAKVVALLVVIGERLLRVGSALSRLCRARGSGNCCAGIDWPRRFPIICMNRAPMAAFAFGRASCRDRLCQVVYISVFAVYIKQNIIIVV